MKKAILFLVVISVFVGCKKNDDNTFVPGKIITQVNYRHSTSKNIKQHNPKSDSLYTGYGDYITSISPSIFKAKFNLIRYVDELATYNQIELINNNLPYDDPRRYADFTNNSSVTLTPDLYGNTPNEGTTFGSTVLFNYFYFHVIYFYQEIPLPSQYTGIDTLDQFSYPNGSLWDENNQTFGYVSNNVLKAHYRLFLSPKFGQMQRGVSLFVFGGTDSSYVLNMLTDDSLSFPYNNEEDYIVRSKNYTPITFVPSENNDKTTYINATLSFDYENLIQIYAGPDNIPYTRDDVFFYEPYFYDRLNVSVVIE